MSPHVDPTEGVDVRVLTPHPGAEARQLVRD